MQKQLNVAGVPRHCNLCGNKLEDKETKLSSYSSQHIKAIHDPLVRKAVIKKIEDKEALSIYQRLILLYTGRKYYRSGVHILKDTHHRPCLFQKELPSSNPLMALPH